MAANALAQQQSTIFNSKTLANQFVLGKGRLVIYEVDMPLESIKEITEEGNVIIDRTKPIPSNRIKGIYVPEIGVTRLIDNPTYTPTIAKSAYPSN